VSSRNARNGSTPTKKLKNTALEGFQINDMMLVCVYRWHAEYNAGERAVSPATARQDISR